MLANEHLGGWSEIRAINFQTTSTAVRFSSTKVFLNLEVRVWY